MEFPRDEDLRVTIGNLLAAGLKTQTEPFPETHVEFAQVLDELRQLPRDAYKEKLIVSGVTNKPYGPDQNRCSQCMYYLVHRKWCDVPEQSIPVEPDWWCRLWRI
jgi:hypothetical protein